jgi:hypothetical protein
MKTHIPTYVSLSRPVEGMSDETLRWKLFPFSLTGGAKHWYMITIGNNQGDREALCSNFC